MVFYFCPGQAEHYIVSTAELESCVRIGKSSVNLARQLLDVTEKIKASDPGPWTRLSTVSCRCMSAI
jgi:hypothetical protein